MEGENIVEDLPDLWMKKDFSGIEKHWTRWQKKKN